MRSFFEFVSRCIKAPKVSTTEEAVTSAPRMAAVRNTKKKKRVKLGTPLSMIPEWKPSLYVISEDNVTAEKKEKTTPEPATSTRPDTGVKTKSTAGSRSKVHVRSYSDDIGRNSVPVVIPTFSPTPFIM